MIGKDWVWFILEKKKDIGAHLPIHPSMALLALGATSTDPAKASSPPSFRSLFSLQKKLAVGSMNKGACFVMFRVCSKDLLVFFFPCTTRWW